jgi:hypothetical protein
MRVSFFTYLHATCREILELHLRTIEPVVDHVVITESNVTHAGLPAEPGLDQALEEIGWPRHKVTVIRLEISACQQLEIQPIDVANTHELHTNLDSNSGNLRSQQARVRERLQKDSLLQVLADFPDDTVFLHSDCDEIIDPANLPYLAVTAWHNQHVIIKVPLIYLQGRADLRVYYRDTDLPVPWHGGMFLATKAHFARATPSQIRSNNFNPWPIMYVTEQGRVCEDLGWHFSWMGSVAQRQIKAQNFAHHADRLSFLGTAGYDTAEHGEFLERTPLRAGMTPPSGDKTHQLRDFPTARLPKSLWQSPGVREFVLPVR